MSKLRMQSEVADALAAGAPVVALESAVITSGLPREPLSNSSRLAIAEWDRTQPVNLELARAMQRTVRESGAVPATIAIIQGDLCIGIEDDELTLLAEEKCAAKASVTDMAAIMVAGGSAGTTVSATLAACAVAHPKINVFATGGIGGVHRDWQEIPDISADLRQIAKTPVCVVCSGAKSILDLPATLEMLEMLGVPVLGFCTDRFPQFMCEGDEQLPVKASANVQSIAEICRTQWHTLRNNSGILLTNPPPAEYALERDELEMAIEQAERNAADHYITGSKRTPFLLTEIAELTAGRSVDANIALLINNAKLAAQVAVAMAD